jgi:8-oxo-dGTP diphosphatase
MSIIEEINVIRDIPYRIPLAMQEEDHCCTGKHRRAKKVLESHGYSTRFRLGEFLWSGMSLPADLQRLPHEDLCQHAFLEFKQGNDEWSVLDITWDQPLLSVLPITSWDGTSSTQLAVPIYRWLSPEESERVMSLEGEALRRATEEDLQKNGMFYAALNAYLEGVRERRLDQVKVGIGVFILKDNKILLRRRGGAHGAGLWGAPGGHLEWMESIEECARRETMEEAGIKIKNLRILSLSDLLEYAPKHYLNIGVLADWESGELKNLEPERWQSDWGWYAVDALPEPVFPTVPVYLSALRTGVIWKEASSRV